MTCVFYLTDVFQIVINSFNKSAFSKHDFIVHKHQSVLHVLFYLGCQMYAVHKKLFEQVFGDVVFQCCPIKKTLFLSRITFIGQQCKTLNFELFPS